MRKKNKGGRPPVHESSLKVAVSRDYLTSNLSRSQLALKYNVTADQVDKFLAWYRKRYPQQIAEGVVNNNAPLPVPCSDEADLLKELKEANLKIEALEMMIEIARTELGIDIVKKPGTKQS